MHPQQKGNRVIKVIERGYRWLSSAVKLTNDLFENSPILDWKDFDTQLIQVTIVPNQLF